jgi:rhamnosyltransferase
MDNNIKISACIVLFNPGQNSIKNLFLILNQVSRLYIVDNSEFDFEPDLLQKSDVVYIKNYCNNGIAFALNQAANLAINEGFNYLLTLDQDSIPDPQLINVYTNFLKNNNDESVAWLAPNYLYADYQDPMKKNIDYPILHSMTSGSLLNLDAYKKIGPFLDSLFIDFVDTEYCLRIRQNGYSTYKIRNANIYHNLGGIKGRKFFFLNISVTNHSPLRLYYRTRNRFFVYKLYLINFPFFVFKDLIVFINELLKIIIYENNKLNKYKFIFYGFKAFLKNQMGKYES